MELAILAALVLLASSRGDSRSANEGPRVLNVREAALQNNVAAATRNISSRLLARGAPIEVSKGRVGTPVRDGAQGNVQEGWDTEKTIRDLKAAVDGAKTVAEILAASPPATSTPYYGAGAKKSSGTTNKVSGSSSSSGGSSGYDWNNRP